MSCSHPRLYDRSPYNPHGWAVKRIIGLEGDIVRTKKPYPFAEEKVPQGHIWVEGDGEKTLDSNTYGPISKSLLVGKAVYMLLPLRKFGPIEPAPVGGRLVR
jgi:inner membrane protease subunit 2